MGHLEMAHEYPSLGIKVSTAQAVHPRLADGEHLRMPGTLFQQVKVGIVEAVHIVPGMVSHRVPQPRLRGKLPRIDSDECRRGVSAMGMAVDDRCHGTGS